MSFFFNFNPFFWLLFVALFAGQPLPTNGIQWLALSKISSVVSTGGQPDQICDAMKGSLVKKQINFCKKNPSFMDSVRIGAARAIDECQFQFRSTRWNCSALNEKINSDVDKMKSDLSLITQDYDRKQQQFPSQFGAMSSGFSTPNSDIYPHDSMYSTNPNLNSNSNSNKRKNTPNQSKAKRGKRLSRKARHGLTDDNLSPNLKNNVFKKDVGSSNTSFASIPDRENEDQEEVEEDEDLDDVEEARKHFGKKHRKTKLEPGLKTTNDKTKKRVETVGNQFQTTIGGPYPVVAAGTRESAFVHAISSAGVAHALTRACSSGELDNCGCDRSLKGISPEGFQWSGCSDNIDFGITFSRNFVDARDRRKSREKPKKDQPLMNLHNNEAGRKLLERNMKIECKCHGVSGSCELKTCWRSVASFRLVGEILKEKFDNAHEVQQKKRRGRRMLLPKSQWFKPLTDTDLVFLRPSSDYCEFDVKKGSLGTHGRECDPRSPGIDGCELMCCNRGYTTRREPRKERCRCKFHWCCFVECEECYNEVEVSTCN